MKLKSDNGTQLRECIEAAGLTQKAALELFNEGQVKPMAMRTLKTYLACADSKTRIECPEAVLDHFKKVCAKP